MNEVITEASIEERLKRYLPIRCVIRQKPDRKIQGLIELSFATDWSDDRVNIFWSGKAYSILGEHTLDGISWAEHNKRHEDELVIDPLAEDSPIKIDWESWLNSKSKYDKRNASFTQVSTNKLKIRRIIMSNIAYQTFPSDTATYISFTTKEEYLAFRKEWKSMYLGKIEEIRKLKRDLKEDQRAKPHDSHWKIYRALNEARNEIAELLSDKRKAAEEAQRQYLENKELMNE